MTFKIYQITSPSGRSYIGFTSNSIVTRWQQHRAQARYGKKHPFYEAIRKYGAENFIVAELSSHESQIEAFAEEIRIIAAAHKPYNISPGGGEDCFAGRKRFVELLKDPKWREAYGKKLSISCKNSEKYRAALPKMLEKLKEWRAANPRKAHYMQRRITRLATKKNRGRKPWNLGKKHTLESRRKMSVSGKARHAKTTSSQKKKLEILRRGVTTRAWARRTPEQKKAIAAKIRKTLKLFYKTQDPQKRKMQLEQLVQARKNIDHDLRTRNQKKSLIAYWTPERRAIKSKMLKEGENYANVRHNQFRAQK